jgi:hypothetical protein
MDLIEVQNIAEDIREMEFQIFILLFLIRCLIFDNIWDEEDCRKSLREFIKWNISTNNTNKPCWN